MKAFDFKSIFLCAIITTKMSDIIFSAAATTRTCVANAFLIVHAVALIIQNFLRHYYRTFTVQANG